MMPTLETKPPETTTPEPEAPTEVPLDRASEPADAAAFLDAVGAAAQRRRRAIVLAVVLTLAGLSFFLALFFGLTRGFDALARQASGSLSGTLAPTPPQGPRAPQPAGRPTPTRAARSDDPAPPGL